MDEKTKSVELVTKTEDGIMFLTNTAEYIEATMSTAERAEYRKLCAEIGMKEDTIVQVNLCEEPDELCETPLVKIFVAGLEAARRRAPTGREGDR